MDSDLGTSALLGRRLGAYQVLSLIAVGGMGEVYRARDTKLGRDVAIKMLPRLSLADPDRRNRFDREAVLLASLSHPHIGAIYGVEDNDGVRALVLELVEGPTLADRLANGPMSISETLAIATQIADALDAAHQQGIVHRDLKPANVKITSDGVVKVLDFGIAKAVSRVAGPDAAESPTITVAGTREGVILGTTAYMSPEQARGQTVDKRTDIWAFGCVLYEMLTGRAAFAGRTTSDTIARIIEREPDWSALPAATPPSVKRLAERCLEKDPKRRLRDIGDARTEIDENPRGPASAQSIRRWQWIGVLLLTIGAVGGWAVSRLSEPAISEKTWQLQIAPPQGGRFAAAAFGFLSIALSPAGDTAAYVASVDGKTALWVRRLDSKTDRQLSDTEGAESPFWSPDGKAIGFFRNRKLQRVDLAEGVPQTICELSAAPLGGAWTDDGRILFGLLGQRLFQVPSSGGTPSPLTTLDASLGEVAHAWPQILPGGRFLYWVASSDPEHTDGVYAAPLTDPRQRVRLLTSKTSALYAPTREGKGHLLLWRDGTLVAQSFDAATLELSGEPVPLADAAGANVAAGKMDVAVSAGGTLLYGAPNLSRLAWFDRTGTLIGMLGEPSAYFAAAFRISPDGRHVAATRTEGGRDLWLLEVERGISRRFTVDEGGGFNGLWSTDGRTILFMGDNVSTLYRKDASGAAKGQRLAQMRGDTPNDWSRDGHFVIFTRTASDTKADLWILPAMPDGNLPPSDQPRPYLQTPFNEARGRFSPDSRWVAYESDKTGRSEVYLQTFPEPHGEWRISTAGGTEPRWGASGRELFYRTPAPNTRMMVVDVKLGADAVEASAPRELFSLPGIGFEVAPDGRRFLSAIPANQAASSLTVIINWPALVKQTATR